MGRRQFEAVVAQASREYLETKAVTFASPVAVNELKNLLVYAPVGFIGELVAIRLEAPAVAGAASGYHQLYLAYDTGFWKAIDTLTVRGDYNNPISVQYGKVHNPAPITGTAYYHPVEESAQQQAIKGMLIDDKIGLSIGYKNSANVVQNGAVEVFYTIRYRQIAK